MPRQRAARIKRLLRLNLWLWPATALAQEVPQIFGNTSLLTNFCEGTGYDCQPRNETFFAQAMGSVVFALLTFTGLVFTALIVYGGYKWMLARGNEQEVEKGKAIIRSAIIGLIVTLASYSIWLTVAYFL